jgi:hypothetical protein
MAYVIKTNVTNEYGQSAYFTGYLKGQKLFVWSKPGTDIKAKAIRFESKQVAIAYINKFKFKNCSIESYNVEQSVS